MADIQVVFLGQKGDIKQGKLKGVSIPAMTAAFKKKDPPSLLGKYVWKQKAFFLFGYLEGKDSTENQHHLPEPLEGMTFYGDIMVLASTDLNSYTQPVNLKTAEYETFYTGILEGGDEDENDSDEEGEGEEAPPQPDDLSDGEGEEGFPQEDDVNDDDEEGEEPVLEKPTRVVKSRKVVAVIQAEEEELDLTCQSPHRTQVQASIRTLFTELTDAEVLEFENIILSTAFDTAKKEEIRKAWSSPLFLDIYLATARRIVGNLQPNTYVQNKYLWERYNNKEITLEQIAKQNYYELCPGNWQIMLDRQAKQEQIQLEGDFSRATDKWMCNGCKMRKCTYYELQTRSADEPMTIFIQCLNCGKRWTH